MGLSQQVIAWLNRIDLDEPLAVDTETTSLHVGGDALTIGVSLAQRDLGSLYVPIAHAVGENVDTASYWLLRGILEHHRGPLVFANVQFDVLALENQGITVDHRDLWDVILMAHLIDENRPMTKSLDMLAEHYLGDDIGKVSTPFLDEQKKTGWPDTSWQDMDEYARVDAELTLALYEALHPKFVRETPPGLWTHKQRLIRALLDMRRLGVRIDTALSAEHIALAEEAMAGSKLLLDLGPKETLGPKALERLLHDELGIPILHTTPGGKPQFNKKSMADYEVYLDRAGSPIASALKTYRGWQKASTAATIPYLEMMDSDGRLRCSYKMHGTVTGRLSCEKPNLQQIPKAGDKPWNGTLKECFIAADGYTLINADFSQLELRLGTAYAGEQALKEAFEEGRDVFDEMAETLGWPRQDVKTFVYSVSYGAGIPRIMGAFGIGKAEAEAMRADYFRRYPLFKAAQDRATRQVEKQGFIKTWSGRKRRFQYPTDSYKAWNSLIQGGAADLMERVMVRCHETLHSDTCRMLLQVHDSLTWEIRNDRVAAMMPKIHDVMADVEGATGVDFGVRFEVDVDFWTRREREKHEGVVAGSR